MPDFVYIDGRYRNADEIRTIHPAEGGQVAVMIGSKLHHFDVGAGNENAWAAALATSIGRVFDLSETPQPPGGQDRRGFRQIPAEFLDDVIRPHDTSVIPPEIREHLPYRINAGGRPAPGEADA